MEAEGPGTAVRITALAGNAAISDARSPHPRATHAPRESGGVRRSPRASGGHEAAASRGSRRPWDCCEDHSSLGERRELGAISPHYARPTPRKSGGVRRRSPRASGGHEAAASRGSRRPWDCCEHHSSGGESESRRHIPHPACEPRPARERRCPPQSKSLRRSWGVSDLVEAEGPGTAVRITALAGNAATPDHTSPIHCARPTPREERRSPPQSKSLRRSWSATVSWMPKALGLL